MPAPVALLLAAGFSTRFGSDKLLVPLAGGVPMAVVACRRYQAAGLVVHALVRPEQQALRDLLADTGAVVHVAEACRAGIGSSIAAGVGTTATAAGWIIGLADMPFVSTDTIAAVRAAIENGAAVAAPIVAGRRGHPVGFAPHFGESLRLLSGDEGARRLVQAAGETLQLIASSDVGALRDIDRADDLAGLVDRRELSGPSP